MVQGFGFRVWNFGLSMCSGSEVGSYLRLIDACITQLKAQGPGRGDGESGFGPVRRLDLDLGNGSGFRVCGLGFEV